MERTGIVFGCFIPLHDGHISVMNKALKENDKLYIVVCGHKGDRGDSFIPFEDREMLMKKFIKCYYPTQRQNIIFVVSVDDFNIHPDGDFSKVSWEGWINEFFKTSKACTDDTYTWYTGEENYISEMKKTRPNDNFILMDRSVIKISGTMIRDNLDKYSYHVPLVYLNYLKERK